jgi:hypothetical protein
MFVDFLKLLDVVDIEDGKNKEAKQLASSSFQIPLQRCKISGDLWACCQPMPMQQILPKTAKICPKTKL